MDSPLFIGKVHNYMLIFQIYTESSDQKVVLGIVGVQQREGLQTN